MGAKNCPETPRQKMVGLMYIVFMALVALNVAGEVLVAFDIVNESMSEAKELSESRNAALYNDIKAKNGVNPLKVGPFYKDALETKKRSDAIVKYIQKLKVKMVKMADGPDGDVNHIHLKDNLDKGPQLMLGIPGVPGKGKILREKISSIKEYYKTICKDRPDLVEGIDVQLATDERESEHEEGEVLKWENYMFGHMPLIACIVMLSKTQADIRNTEATVIKHLVSSITSGGMSFPDIEAVVTTESNYVLRGGVFEAQIFLAAYDKKNAPKVTMANSSIPLEINKDNGKAIFRKAATKVGTYPIKGVVSLMRLDGNPLTRTFESSYTVGERGLVVSATKMNVMYRGVPNPLEVSVPGVPTKNLTIRISDAEYETIRPGIYEVNPTKKSRKVLVTVFAQIGNQKVNMGVRDFRVKTIPDPVGKVAGRTFGAISKAELLAQVGIVAALENFVFDIRYVVQSFTVSATVAGFSKEIKSKSYKFTKEQKGFIKRLRRQTKLYIEDIIAVGPDGKKRKLPAISLKIT